LLDWSVEKTPDGETLRAALYAAGGKYPYVRVEEIISVEEITGEAAVLRRSEMVGDQLIAKLTDGATAESLRAAVEAIGGALAEEPFAPDTWLAALPPRLDAVPDAVGALGRQSQTVAYAEPNFLVRPARTPNDPRFVNFSQWHLYNNRETDKDIKAPRAWDRRVSAAYGGTNKVIVAVIDTGVRYTHEDLLPNMWTNPGEVPGDGIDNDGNNLIDDVYGADYLMNDGDPMTSENHGTHVAGLIAAAGNNGLGVAGVAWDGVQIMALRFLENNSGSLSDSVRCIDYAIDKGAKIINASYGSSASNSTEAEAIYRAQQTGVILVAAAGNDGTDNDLSPFYPASYTEYVQRIFPRRAFALDNIIAVGATDRNDAKAGFSNYGATSVDLMAPGVEMWSTSISGTSNSHYTSGQGTSFAAPVVAGALALRIAEFPDEPLAQRVAAVLGAVDVVSGLVGRCSTGGRLNLAKLLPAAAADSLPQALVWHRPDYTENLIGSAMRAPSVLAPSNTVTVYSGTKKFNNTNGVNTSGLVNQTGGWLFYRTSPTAPWSSNSLTWHTNSGDYQFWKGTIANVMPGLHEYFLQLDFDSGARTTYSFFSDNADRFSTGTSPTVAQSSPYTFDVPKIPATVTISDTNQIYDGTPRAVTVSTVPSGLSVSITYGGSVNPPTAPGTFSVEAVVVEDNHEGGAAGSLTISLSLFDAWRLEKFGGQWEANADSASSADPDSDGVSNHAEYFLGTDPVDAGSRLAISAVPAGSNAATVTIAPAVVSGDYTLKSWSDLSQAPTSQTLQVIGNAPSASFEVQANPDKNFYQLFYTPPPLP
jgi:subtilisin family serine protease